MPESLSRERTDRTRRVVAWLLVAMVAAGLWDLFTDSPRIWTGSHAVVEVAFILLAGATALVLLRGWMASERSLADVRQALQAHQSERDHWRRLAQDALRGLGEALDRQFGEWGLTAAEKEVALFLLKGYSHKDAARLTGRSERTVRQHAVSVYRKSRLAGRAELAAFFFEDMLLPQTPEPGGPVRSPGTGAS